LQATTSYWYDRAGNVQRVSDPTGRVTVYEYDELNRLATEDPPGGERYTYRYDEVGNLTEIGDATGAVYRYGYDRLGRMTEEENRLGGTARYEYDGVGNLVREERFSGEVIRYRYDRMNRLVLRALPEGDERYDYDRNGRITAAENSAAELTFGWDPAGRLMESYNATAGRGLHYEYDRAGNRTAMIFDGGRRVGYAYGVRNEVTALTDPDGRTTTFGYDAVGREVKRMLPNGVTTERNYDRAGRVTTIATRGREGNMAGRVYAYDPAGRITARVDESGAIRSYRYDEAGRLTAVAYPYGREKMRNDLIERIRLGLLEPDGETENGGDTTSGVNGPPWNQPGPPPWTNNDNKKRGDGDTIADAGDDDLIPDWLEPYLTAPPEVTAGTRPLGQNGTVFAERLRLERGEAGVLVERLRKIAVDGARLARDQWVWQGPPHRGEERSSHPPGRATICFMTSRHKSVSSISVKPAARRLSMVRRLILAPYRWTGIGLRKSMRGPKNFPSLRTCSSMRTTPSLLQTRRISRNPVTGRGTEQKTHVLTTVSKVSSANVRFSASISMSVTLLRFISSTRLRARSIIDVLKSIPVTATSLG
jgi:YD repeat-containing protein